MRLFRDSLLNHDDNESLKVSELNDDEAREYDRLHGYEATNSDYRFKAIYDYAYEKMDYAGVSLIG